MQIPVIFGLLVKGLNLFKCLVSLLLLKSVLMNEQMRPLGGAGCTCPLRALAPCLPGQRGSFHALRPIVSVPCLPGLLDLPWLVHHAALRRVHRVAAAEGAHDCELRPGERNCRALSVNYGLSTQVKAGAKKC